MTDRLYNKKQIQKMRNKTSQAHHEKDSFAIGKEGGHEKKSKHKHGKSKGASNHHSNHNHGGGTGSHSVAKDHHNAYDRNISSPKNHSITGHEYLLNNRFASSKERIPERMSSVGTEHRSVTINSNGEQSARLTKQQRRQ